MEKIKSASVKLNENGLLVDVKIKMRANDGDGLYIVHFAIVQETDEQFKFSVLATTNLSDAKTEDDLLENTSEIFLPLYFDSKACAASSIISSLYCFARPSITSMSQGWPAK